MMEMCREERCGGGKRGLYIPMMRLVAGDIGWVMNGTRQKIRSAGSLEWDSEQRSDRRR